MEKIKLRVKQLEALTNIQNQKAQLNTMFEQLNQRESLVLDLILEEVNIDASSIDNIKLDADFITYEPKVPKVPQVKTEKPIKTKRP